MEIHCAAHNATGCQNKVDIRWWKVLFNLFRSGGKMSNIDEYCPEHLEFITRGKISDNDPKTNPQFN
jgi:hypothetical protein